MDQRKNATHSSQSTRSNRQASDSRLKAIENKLRDFLKRKDRGKHDFKIAKISFSTRSPSEPQLRKNFRKFETTKVKECSSTNFLCFKPTEVLRLPQEQQNRFEDRKQQKVQYKKRLYLLRKQQSLQNNILIRQQREQAQASKKAMKFRMLKTQRSAREHLSQFWMEKLRDQQSSRQLKRIPDKISDIKLEQIQMNILRAEEQQLNKLEEMICHQEQIASKIKQRLRLS